MKKTRKRILSFLLTVLGVVAAVFLIYVWQEQLAGSNSKPTIICPTDSITVSVESLADKSILMRDVTAMDVEDGDITDGIVVESVSQFVEFGHCILTYAAFDSANNVSKLTRHLFLTDYYSPRFRIVAPLEFSYSSNFDPLDYVRAYDCVDGDISDRVKYVLINQNDDIYSVGAHMVRFTVMNSLGDMSVIEAEIDVYDKTYTETRMSPVINLSDYLIYVDRYGYVDPLNYVAGISLSGVSYTVSEYRAGSLAVDDIDVDYTTPGTYRILYTCDNRGEYFSSAVLIVVVGEVED
jgi:hypothetical protein